MELFVHNYLFKNYYIKTSDVGNDGIYYLFDDKRIPTPFYGNKLINELSIIFGLDKEISKDYINGWSISVKSDINLNFYWEQESVLFPSTRRVMSMLIGTDLVAVQPMSAPLGTLMYMDFVYSGDTPQTNGRVYDREVVERATEETERQSWYGELEHPQIEINVNPRHEENIISNTLQKWSSIIGVSSRRREE
jgi:hypothetical protein